MEVFLSSLSGILAFLGASLSFLAVFFIMRSRNIDPASASLRARDTLSRAREDADEIIREAESRAEEIVNGAQLLRGRAEERFQKAFRRRRGAGFRSWRNLSKTKWCAMSV